MTDEMTNPYAIARNLAALIYQEAFENGDEYPTDRAFELASYDEHVIYYHRARAFVLALDSDDEHAAFDRMHDLGLGCEADSLDSLFLLLAQLALESMILEYLSEGNSLNYRGRYEPIYRRHVVDDHNGIYSPQVFAERFEDLILENDLTDDHGISILKQGPEHPLYLEVWDDVLGSEVVIGGLRFLIEQDGGIFFVSFGIE